MCYTTGTTGQPERRALLAPRARAAHLRSALDSGHGPRAKATPCCRSCRCSTPTRGACRSARIDGRREVRDARAAPRRRRASSICSRASASRSPAGVPTIWMGVLQFLDAEPGQVQTCRAIRAMYVGGSAVPQSLIEAFERRHGLRILQAWGMTEMAPLGTVAPPAAGISRRRHGRGVRVSRQAGTAVAVRRDPRAQRGRPRAVGRRRRWASSKCAGRGSPAATTTAPTPAIASPTTAGSAPATSSTIDDRRDDPDSGSLEGSDQVGRRVDQLGRARVRADGPSRGRRGRGHPGRSTRSGANGRSPPSC